MRILYGVVGEGMGHAIRSRVVLERLVREGHEVEIMTSGRAVEFLGKHFRDVNRIHGLHMVYQDNRVSAAETLWSNLKSSIKGVPRNVAAYFELVDDFRPELVISDFESWAHLYAKLHGLPVISIDNMQIINRCKHPADVLEGHRTSFELTRAFIKAKLPRCFHYVITTFFRPPVRKKKTTLVPPILRSEILEAEASRGEHLLVYQTGEGYQALLETLRGTDIECRLYGLRRHITEEEVDGNLRFQPFSEEGFIQDLATSRAVIAGGGFTLMGEAVYLKKPMLSVPLEGQLEQVLNARYLARMHYGMCAASLEEPSVVRHFVEQLPKFEEALAGYRQKGNKKLYRVLQDLMDRAEAGIA